MQKNNHLYNFISKKKDKDNYDVILYQVNNILFNYGDHQNSTKNNFVLHIISFIKKYIDFIYNIYFSFGKNKKNKIIISNAYVSINFDDYTTFAPPWSNSLRNKIISTYRLSRIVGKIKSILSKKSLKLLFSSYFETQIKLYEKEFSNFLIKNQVKCIIVPNDLDFFENLSIKIANKNNIPSFVYLHGLPGRYNLIDDNRADYLIVWGLGIKNTFIHHGVLPNKILTIKHPFYSEFKFLNLTSSLDNVLVLTKAISGTPSSSDELFFGDRSKSLLYLEMLKMILIELGVKKACLRLHPSESVDFYKRNLTCDFFKIDFSNKIDSLTKASLVIGPTSTMVLDAIKAGVNYILYEPKIDNILLDNSKDLVPPFDGLSFINLSETIEEFKYHIEHPNVNIDILKLNQYFEVVETDYEKFIEILK